MQPFFTLVRRELGGFFGSFTGYVIISAVAFLIGMTFINLLQALMNDSLDAPLNEVYFNTQYFWLLILLAPPVITMRTFAQEKATGTYETLMTAPVGDATVVMAKFTGSLLFYLVTWLPLLGCLLVVRNYLSDPAALDPAVIGSTFLGIFFIGCIYMAMGCYASSLTGSHAVAAMISLALGIALFLLGFLSHPDPVTWLQRALVQVSLTGHMRDFSKGVVDLRAVTFCGSMTVFFLFLTLKSVQSRRWK